MIMYAMDAITQRCDGVRGETEEFLLLGVCCGVEDGETEDDIVRIERDGRDVWTHGCVCRVYMCHTERRMAQPLILMSALPTSSNLHHNMPYHAMSRIHHHIRRTPTFDSLLDIIHECVACHTIHLLTHTLRTRIFFALFRESVERDEERGHRGDRGTKLDDVYVCMYLYVCGCMCVHGYAYAVAYDAT